MLHNFLCTSLTQNLMLHLRLTIPSSSNSVWIRPLKFTKSRLVSKACSRPSTIRACSTQKSKVVDKVRL